MVSSRVSLTLEWLELLLLNHYVTNKSLEVQNKILCMKDKMENIGQKKLSWAGFFFPVLCNYALVN